MMLAPLVVDDARGDGACEKTIARLNEEFAYTQKAVLELNRFKYKTAGIARTCVMQTALYELGEIAELYHLQCPTRWTQSTLQMHYRMQWGTKERLENLERFQQSALRDGDRDVGSEHAAEKGALAGQARLSRRPGPCGSCRTRGPTSSS